MNGAVMLLGCILAKDKTQFFKFYPHPMGEKMKKSSDYWERVEGIKSQSGKRRSKKAMERDKKNEV